MRNLKYITPEAVIKITNKKNEINYCTRKAIELINPHISEKLIGTKLRTVSNNGFVKSFKLKSHDDFERYAYSIYFDSLGYLYLKIRSKKDNNYAEYTLLKTDKNGIVERIVDFKECGKIQYNPEKQIELVDKIKDLQLQIEELAKGLIYEIQG